LLVTEISLNGGIVSNKGFIAQFAPPGTKIIEGKYISAWGGIQSAGQTVGQIVGHFVFSCFKFRMPADHIFQFLQFATEAFGRKIALLILWGFLTAVSINLVPEAFQIPTAIQLMHNS
jgi:MFS family permease